MDVRIASPCSARWEDMEGDERSRFCRHCSKNVYNFTAMSQDEITSVIREKEGRLCARIYQRADGKMLINDCRHGVRWFAARMKFAVYASVATVAFVAAAILNRRLSDPEPDAYHLPVRARIEAAVDDAIWKAKEMLGIPMPIAGAIACPMPRNSTNGIPNSTILCDSENKNPDSSRSPGSEILGKLKP